MTSDHSDLSGPTLFTTPFLAFLATKAPVRVAPESLYEQVITKEDSMTRISIACVPPSRTLGEEAIMKKLIATAFIASAGLALASSAQAMPIAPLDKHQVGAVIQVFGGCGWGRHRGPLGACRPLYNCPPGWHTGPWGRVCRPNR